MRLVTLGVGNAFSRLHYSSCMAVGVNEEWLLIDCPHPIFKMLHEASLASGVPLSVERLCGVALTHLHADHSSGLEGLLYYSRIAFGRPTRLATHSDVAAALWTGHLSGGMEYSAQAGEPPVRRRPQDFYELISLSENNDVEVGPFAVRCRRTIHSVPTTALLIRGGGRVLGYSADTEFDPGLIEWLSAADLIVHETGEHGPHTSLNNLAALPVELRGKLRLIHYADDFDFAASPIEALRPGRCYEV